MVRLRKQMARKMFDRGYSVYLVPCNVNPFTMWGESLTGRFNRRLDTVKFDTCVESYKFHTCNSELGRYPHYYADIEDVKEFMSDYEE